jgi:type IV secretion system protein VirD4
MTTGARPDGSWSVIEIALVAAIATVAGAALLAWLLGAVAGTVFGDGIPEVAVERLPAILGSLPGHLDDPRLAWPASVRAGLPGLGGFIVAAALILIVLTGGGIASAGLAGRLSNRADAGAAWGRARDLRTLRVRKAGGGRLVIGRQAGHLIAAEPRQSVIVVAPTQTGKTTGLAVPALLEWDGPVLATSIKTDLLSDTFDRRAQVGDVKVFDPTAVAGQESAQWTPLSGCIRWQDARATAERLCNVAKPGRGMTDGDFWTSASARFLAPLLYAAAAGELGMVDVLRWVESTAQDEPRGILAGLQYDDDPAERVAATAALTSLQSVWDADERLRSSLVSTLGVALDAYGDPDVVSSSHESELTPDWLLGGSNTAFLCATATGQERLRPLFVTLIDQVVSHVYDQAARTGKPIDPPLLLVLDEAANIAPLPRLDQLAATGAGQGIQLVTVIQDLAQVETRWGAKAGTIVNNHRAKLFGPGISCEKTLSYLTRVLGDEAIAQRSTTRGESGRRSTTQATTYRSLAPADRLRQGDHGTGVLVYGNLPPARIDLRPWYADADLRRLAAT